MDAPDDRKEMGAIRELWKMLAHQEAGSPGSQSFELAANLGRSVGFRIKGIEMRRAAELKKHDHALGGGFPRPGALFGTKDARQR
jgi:hypothetical protein